MTKSEQKKQEAKIRRAWKKGTDSPAWKAATKYWSRERMHYMIVKLWREEQGLTE